MNKAADMTFGKKSRIVPSKENLDEIIRCIDSIDQKLEKFYAIHGEELMCPPIINPNIRRLKWK